MTAFANALAYASVHDDIKFDKVAQISIKTTTSPELPVFNQLSEQDVDFYHQDDLMQE